MHLINDGIATATDTEGGAVAIIEWGLSASGEVMQSQAGFSCSLDGGAIFDCKLARINVPHYMLRFE